MKRLSNYLILIFATLLMLGYATNTTSAKLTESEGTQFWFAIPKVDCSLNEQATGSLSGNYFEMWITSKVSTTVRFYDSRQTLISSNSVIGGKQTTIAIPDGKMHTVSESIEKSKALYVESDDPISLTVYIAYNYTGEAFRVLPLSCLGTDYYTLNLYNDYLLFRGESVNRSTQCEFLIVATENGTTVDINPATETAKHVAAGGNLSINLDKGESYLVLSDTNYITAHNAETDLTGSHIVANKPIAVFSGHAKGAFPELSPRYRGIMSDWGRNVLVETMIPTNLLGKHYLIIPNSYSDRLKGYQNLIANDKGDMIRFVATKNNTVIEQLNVNGSSKLVTIKKAGEWFDIACLESPGYFSASEPVLVGQYGKTWMYWANGYISYKEGEENSKEDELQTPNLSGQGQLYCAVPCEQWSTFAGFVAPSDAKNWFNLIFKTGDEQYLTFNGTPILQVYGNGVKKIDNTPYSYISQMASNGYSYVESSNANALFMLYSYGDMDGNHKGFAYGYPATMNLYSYCSDSVYINAQLDCNVLSGSVNALNLVEDTLCAAIQTLKYNVETCRNAVLTSEIAAGDLSGDFSVEFPDKSQEGYIEISAITKSGSITTSEFYYHPEILSVDTDSLQFGLVEPGKPRNLSINISNAGINTVNVKRLYFRDASPELSITTLPVSDFGIASGEEKNYSVQVNMASDNQSVTDYLYAEMECGNQLLATINANSGGANITMANLEWKDIQIKADYEKTKQLKITNNGNATSYISGYKLANPDDTHFSFTGLEGVSADNMLEIEPNGGSVTFMVSYDHKDEIKVEHSQTLTLLSPNTTGTKITSTWTGNAIDTTLSVGEEDKALFAITNIIPNPVYKDATIGFTVPANSRVVLGIFDESGRLVKSVIDDDKLPGVYQTTFDIGDLASGSYTCQIKIGKHVEIRQMVVTK